MMINRGIAVNHPRKNKESLGIENIIGTHASQISNRRNTPLAKEKIRPPRSCSESIEKHPVADKKSHTIPLSISRRTKKDCAENALPLQRAT
jgi:hypothetical protein